MNILLIKGLLSLSMIFVSSTDFITLCDFDTIQREWTDEAGRTSFIRVSDKYARSGKYSLEVDVNRYDNILRSTWGFDAYDLKLTSETRFKFYIHGDPKLKASTGQPHGALLLFESGGGENGTDSQWSFNIPGHLYSGNDWQMFETPPLKDAVYPGWAKDIDGKLDYNKISKVLIVLQREDPNLEQEPFAFYLDDFSATDWEVRQPNISYAINHSTPEHIRPVQRGFINRKREAGQTLLFTDLEKWKIIKYGDVNAEFVRSEEELLFGEPVGKLTYKLNDNSGYIRIEPAKPMHVNDFDAVLMWVFGNEFSFSPKVTYPLSQISLELIDKNDEKHTIIMDQIDWKFWSLMHKNVKINADDDERHTSLGGDNDRKIQFPATFNAINVKGMTKEPRTLYFDSIIFRTERPDLPVFYADIDHLPFPVTDDTILPSYDKSDVRNMLVKSSDKYRFISKSVDSDIVYTYTPLTGTLSDLIVDINGISFKPCENAGIAIDDKTLSANLIDLRRIGINTLESTWRTENGIIYKLSLKIKGKSLICDWSSDDTGITGLSLGFASGLADYKLFEIPYIPMSFTSRPAVLWNQGIFCFTILDWYNTNASEFYAKSDRQSDKSAVYNGGSRYLTLTDGSRNELKERQFITVSNDFNEILPNIPNPPSPFGDITGKYLYCHVGGTALDRFQTWLKYWRLYKEHGIDYVRLSQHEDGWSDGDLVGQGPQEFTMTLDAAPEIGDRQLIDYCAEVKKLGWLIGLYSNYTDYSMLGKSWDERNVTKLPNGEWKRVWPPCFNIKPLKAVEMEEYFARRIAEKFGTNTVYCDVHTAVWLWFNVDYEKGTPGAGKLSTTFKSYGKLMMNERKAYNGPVFSEGTHHWFYAGLNDGNYAQMGLPEPSKQPLLLDFDLRKIHPLQANIAMVPGWEWDAGYFHMMATQIAYGHIGFLPAAGNNVRFAASGYYLMQQLQSRYTMVPAEKILYNSTDGKLVNISEALPIGANKNNQVYVKYKNGLDVYVNRNEKTNWTINAVGREFILTPSSWIAFSDDFLEYSTNINDTRVSYVDSPVYTYVDAGKTEFDFGSVTASGSLVIRKDDPRGLKLIPIDSSSVIRLEGYDVSNIEAYSGDDKKMAPVEFSEANGVITLITDKNARYYILYK